MSLRYQIIFRILLSSFCILLLGGAFAIWQARQAVAKEVDASIHLALQLISLGIACTPSFHQMDDLSQFRALRQTRHLSIQLQKPNGQLIHFAGDQGPSNPQDMPPDWFIQAVTGEYPNVEHRIKSQDGETLILIIKAQPLDEITEVWQESLVFFSSFALLTLLTFLMVNLVLGKSLKSIEVIVAALVRIETGEYDEKLPTFSSKEFDSIAKAINHMSLELGKTRQENRALTQHSLAIQEDERQRLSQELHDEFGQSLTAIKVMAITATRQPTDTLKINNTISGICDHLMSVLRSMMQQLHPLILTELGLKATLEEMVNHWSERNPNLKLRINCSEQVDVLDKNITRQLFRVIQEGLTNVVRHAQANLVTIDLYLSADNKLVLKLIDDGQGCDLLSLSRGFGLRGIQERIKSLDGGVQLFSQPGAGMQISAWIPIS